MLACQELALRAVRIGHLPANHTATRVSSIVRYSPSDQGTVRHVEQVREHAADKTGRGQSCRESHELNFGAQEDAIQRQHAYVQRLTVV